MSVDLKCLSKQMPETRVLVVGDAMLDRYWYGDVERISPEAPVPVVRVGREEYRLGGAANVAYNIRTLGAKVTLMTVIGNDEGGLTLRKVLQEKGVESSLCKDEQLKTIVKLRVISRSQQLIRLDFENRPRREALESLTAEFVRHINQFDVVVFSDYGKGGLDQIADMIQAARAAGKPILVDPKGTDYSTYANATVITPNRAELALVVGAWLDEAGLYAKAQELRETLSCDALLLTRSEEGMTLFESSSAINFPTEAREVFDITGAGDTVIATLAVLLATGMSIRDAVPIANRAGGIVVGKFGTATLRFEELYDTVIKPC